ncbi:MAG: MurR/RpiR family transcriptional regulator [Acidobacteria bacterium]|nr:MurR/RpiR family transcriptional regulator [Acidobacteriota bacterium]
MGRIQNETEFKRLVLEHFNHCPPQQQQIAEYVLEHLQEVPFLSIPDLAKRSGVSEATIVRFAKTLNYPGFTSLKQDLVQILKDRIEKPESTQANTAEHETLFGNIARQEIRNIENSLEKTDWKRILAACERLAAADSIYSFGLGISFTLAELMTYHLVQIGLRASTLPSNFTSPLEILVTMRPQDCLVVFSLPPYSKAPIELLRYAKERNIHTLAVTDKHTSPAGQIADNSLVAQTQNMLFTNALAATTVLINTVSTEIAMHHGARSIQAINWLNRIFQEDNNLVT